MIALLYGLVTSWIVFLRKLAACKHNRVKNVYETANDAFIKVEQECKLHEVAFGGPADYHAQMRLLRLFDEKEKARTAWLRAHRKLADRKRMERRLRKFNGRKLPYTFGLIDMAFLFKLIDVGREFGYLNLATIVDSVKSWIG